MNKDFEKIKTYLMDWVGYCEKKSPTSLGDMNFPKLFHKENVGINNFTIFAKEYKNFTGIDLQKNPWCDMFIDSCFVHVFGKEKAERYLKGFSAYTPTSANNFKKHGLFSKNPTLGAQVFFHNEARINHTGFVYNFDENYIDTIEGNTSNGKAIIANGGEVCVKRYKRNNGRIAGYGMIVYDGWHFADGKYFYTVGDKKYKGYTSIDGLNYFFDESGFMKTGDIFINGKRHFFIETQGKYLGAELCVGGIES